jgi:alkanesulfonate monooxygenase SsuD/methylene tetrahydromethanopterin reductase-like flavin-dependent oxidoreductase (luciferase family)
MKFGFLLVQRQLEQVAPLCSLGEQQGFDLVGLVDSPALAYDPHVALALAAQATSRARIGTAVTNPQTRHPLIIANQAATVERLAPGRTYLGLGSGFSGVRQAGGAPATVAGLEQIIAVVRALLAGDTADYHGARLAMSLAPAPVPILIAASGRRMLRLGGAVADLVFFNLGAQPEHVALAQRWIDEGAEAAGRDPASVERWLYTPAAIAPTREQARAEVRNAATSSAVFTLQRDMELKGVPESLHERVEAMVREYDYGTHLAPDRSGNYGLAEQHGLLDYILDRFSIAGSPDDCLRHLAALRAEGLQNVCLNVSIAPDLGAFLRLFGEHVLPTLRDESSSN